MKINSENKTAEGMAFIHLAVVPFALALVAFFIERQLTLILPTAWILVLSALHYARSVVSTHEVDQHRTKVFFKALKYLLLALFFCLVFIAILVVI